MNKYEIIEVNQSEITVDVSLLTKTSEMFFNATEMGKFFGKQPSDFLRLQSTKGYLKALIDFSDGVKSEKDFVFISIFPDYFSFFICRNHSPLFYRFKMFSFNSASFFHEINNSFLFFTKENEDFKLSTVYYYLWDENNIYTEALEKNFLYIFQKPVIFLKIEDLLAFNKKVDVPKNFFGPALGSAISLGQFLS